VFNLPGTVLIDDDKEELYDILTSISSAGIPCIPIHYKNEPGNQTGIDHINVQNIRSRIIITDLNLTDTGSLEPKALVGPIAKVLEPLTNYGPYILLFWSKNESLVEEVVKHLKVRFHNKINLPIHWEVISKSKFKDKPIELKKRIELLIKENSLFNAICDWESRITYAAQKTSNALYKLTTPSDYEPENKTEQHQELFIKALALIGNETVGIKNAAEHPSLAIDLGLSPLLQDQLNMTNDNKNLWREAVPEIGKYQQLNDSIKSALNTFCHLEEVKPGFPKDCRGVFVSLNPDKTETPEKSNKLEDKLGNSLKSIVHEEFLSSKDLGQETKAEAKAFRKKAREAVQLGFIELSAVCDQAQKKTKLHQYLLAALIPEEFIALTIFKDDNGVERDSSHIGIYRLPKIIIDNKIYVLKLSFKYQIGTKAISTVGNRHYENTWFGKPLFRLKDQILSDISFKCAQYSSRPGIIRFD
jgi:hypothetical protein